MFFKAFYMVLGKSNIIRTADGDAAQGFYCPVALTNTAFLIFLFGVASGATEIPSQYI